MGRYSYSLSDEEVAPGFGGNSDEEEVSSRSQFPFNIDGTDPSEYGAPVVCYCGEVALLETATTIPNQGRLFYTCPNRNDGGCHVWKWWDLAVIEEMKNVREQAECSLVEEVKKVEQIATLQDQVLTAKGDMEDLKMKMKMLSFIFVAVIVGLLAVYLFK